MKSGQELKEELGAETMEEQPLACSQALAELTFLHSPGLSPWGMVLLTVGGAPMYQ